MPSAPSAAVPRYEIDHDRQVIVNPRLRIAHDVDAPQAGVDQLAV